MASAVGWGLLAIVGFAAWMAGWIHLAQGKL